MESAFSFAIYENLSTVGQPQWRQDGFAVFMDQNAISKVTRNNVYFKLNAKFAIVCAFGEILSS